MNYPYLPKKKISHAIAGQSLDTKNISTIQPYSEKRVLPGLSRHPDMTVCPLGGGVYAVSKESFGYYEERMKGARLIKGVTDLYKEYPRDIAFNAVILRNCLFHKLDFTEPEIKEYCLKNNIRFKNVGQGYTKCSTLIADENSVITSDKGLFTAYSEEGIEALLITPGHIVLDGFDYGFIGGAGGKISENEMLFFGDVTMHPDYYKIAEFLFRRDIKITCTKGKLTDCGSLIPIEEG